MAEQSAALALSEAGGDSFARIRALVLDSLPSPHSRRAYAKALDDFFAWYAAAPRGPFSKAVIQQYRATLQQQNLSAATINVRLAALRKLAAEAADNGLLDPALAAGIAKILGARRLGVRAGNWLSREQARALWLAPDPQTLKGKRDRAVLALLIGCGLRRSELAALTLEHLVQRDARWVLADLAGKGGRLRTVPVPNWVKREIDIWTRATGLATGRMFRAVGRGGQAWGSGLSEKAIWWIVFTYGRSLGFGGLAPHDLRRTCAKLCRAAGGDLEQIQFLLGHGSIPTTEGYLGSRQNLTHAVNDDLAIDVENES